MALELIHFLNEGDGIGILSINRPKVLNAINRDTLNEMKLFLEDTLPGEKLKCLIITGSGEKSFAAGADISEMNEMNKNEFQDYCNLAHYVYGLIESNSIPSIAAINGYALGGGFELALACDIRIASQNAKLGFPEVNLGIFPAWGGTQRITRILGIGKSKELIYTGEMISAEEALRIGLVEKVVTKENVLDEAKKMAKIISKRSPVAVRMAKKAINAGSEIDLQQGLLLEKTLALVCFDSQDRKEGMQSFLNKKEPDFKGI